MADFDIAVFNGDGIGPEVMAPALDLLAAVSEKSDYALKFRTLEAGANCYLACGEALPETSVEEARKADAILLSAMGLPDVRYDDGTEIIPQIELRMALGLYAGVRPVFAKPGQYCPLDIPNGKAIDFVLVRESTEGLFWNLGGGEVSENEARETLVITRETSEKLFRFAFNFARQRQSSGQGDGLVTCVDKANVFKAFAYFRGIFDEIHTKFTDLKTSYAYVDAMALWMVQKPWDFDVMVTENMFGDILSDLGAGLMGGLGMAPSADIGDKHAVFQPCHGTAPDIAGQGMANPIAMILSGAMMLEWLGLERDQKSMLADAGQLRRAVETVVDAKLVRTADLGGQSSTADVTAAIRAAL